MLIKRRYYSKHSIRWQDRAFISLSSFCDSPATKNWYEGFNRLFTLCRMAQPAIWEQVPGRERGAWSSALGWGKWGAEKLKGRRAVDGPVEEQVIDCVSVLQLPLFSPRGVYSACLHSVKRGLGKNCKVPALLRTGIENQALNNSEWINNCQDIDYYRWSRCVECLSLSRWKSGTSINWWRFTN